MSSYSSACWRFLLTALAGGFLACGVSVDPGESAESGDQAQATDESCFDPLGEQKLDGSSFDFGILQDQLFLELPAGGPAFEVTGNPEGAKSAKLAVSWDLRLLMKSSASHSVNSFEVCPVFWKEDDSYVVGTDCDSVTDDNYSISWSLTPTSAKPEYSYLTLPATTSTLKLIADATATQKGFRIRCVVNFSPLDWRPSFVVPEEDLAASLASTPNVLVSDGKVCL
jgi:hypothetical protein